MKDRALAAVNKHRNKICVGAIGLASGAALALLVDGSEIHIEFYVGIASAIPVFLLAALLRLAGHRDTVLEMLDEASDEDFTKEVVDLHADAIDDTKRTELTAVIKSRAEALRRLEAMVPGVFASLLATYLLAALGEASALIALARGNSTTLTFIAATLSIVGIAGSVLHLEVFDYRIRFVDRRLLVGLRGVRKIDFAEKFRHTEL